MENSLVEDNNQASRKYSIDTLLLDDHVCMEKMDLIEGSLEEEFSVWFDPNEITIEHNIDKESYEPSVNTETEQVEAKVIKEEPLDQELDDIKKEFDGDSVTKDEIVQQISNLKTEIEVKDEVKVEQILDSSAKQKKGDMLTISKIEEIHHSCNPSNDPYHYCEKCSFKCNIPDCGFITKSKNVFETHQKYVEHKKPSKRAQRNFAKTESNDPKLQRCTYCPYTTKRKEVMRNHIKDCEKKIAVQFQVVLNCLECGFILSRNAKTCKKCGWRIGEKRVLPQKSSASNKKIKLSGESSSNKKLIPDPKETAINVPDEKTKKTEHSPVTKTAAAIKKNTEDVSTTLKCEFCSFKTAQKGTLAMHVLKECKGVLELANSAENIRDSPAKQKDPPQAAKINKIRSSTSSTGSSVLEPDSTTDDHDFVLKCNFCPFKTKNQDVLTNHLKGNCENYKNLLNSNSTAVAHRGFSSAGLWRCGFCSFDASKKNTIVEHMKHECPNFIQVCCSKPGLVKCNQCLFVTRLRGDLVKHLVNGRCSDNPERRCNYCSFATRREEELVTHMMNNCKNFLNKCDKLSSTKEKVTDEVKCDDSPNSNCNNCGFVASYEILEAHKRNCIPTNSKSNKIKCKFCNYSNIRAETVIQHAIYECENTKRVAQQNKNVKIEYSIEEKLKCTVFGCSFVGTNELELTKHTAFYTEHVYRCKYCPFESKNEWPHKAHIWKHEHTGICEFCNAHFKTMPEYNNHIVIHGETNFQCPWCSFKIDNNRSLSEHKRKCKYRTEDCENCSFKTTNSHFLTMHKKHCKVFDFWVETDPKKTSSDVKLSCTLCEFKNCLKSVMVKHYASKHGIFKCIVYKCKLCTFRSDDILVFNTHHCEEHQGSIRVFECPICMENVKDVVEYRLHYLQHFAK